MAKHVSTATQLDIISRPSACRDVLSSGTSTKVVEALFHKVLKVTFYSINFVVNVVNDCLSRARGTNNSFKNSYSFNNLKNTSDYLTWLVQTVVKFQRIIQLD